MKAITRRQFVANGGKTLLGLAGTMAMVRTCMGLTKFPNDRKPLNFIFILIDDMGWKDLNCYGNTFFETPNIDKLAQTGMKFTDAYAAASVCAPTRASIITGKYPATLKCTMFWGARFPSYKRRLTEPEPLPVSLDETTIAEALKSAGYVSAAIGKWHLSDHLSPEHRLTDPDKQGFDLTVKTSTESSENHRYNIYTPQEHIDSVKVDKNDCKGVGFLTQQATKFIEKNKNNPFFLYLAHETVHTPLLADKELIEKYKAKLKPDQFNSPVYAAMVEALDNSVKEILDKVDELEIADRTVIIFTSDNGGQIDYTENFRDPNPAKRNYVGIRKNTPLRAGKDSMYEGGLRVPLLISWPGVTKAGSVCSEPVISPDFYPTILEGAGVKPNDDIEGESLMPLLKQNNVLKRNTIYWHCPHYVGMTGEPSGPTMPCGVVRHGNFKLIEFYEDSRLELYNLKYDIGEKTNLADKLPLRAEKLRKMLHDWLRSVNADMPCLNIDYDPSKSDFFE